MNILAFDVGGTTIKYGIVNEYSEVLLKGSITTPGDENSFLETVNKIISTNQNSFDKISIAMPGFVNKQDSSYLWGANLKYAIDFTKINGFDFSKFYIDNDGNVAAYSEYLLHYSNKFSNLIMLTFGTGIGGGIIAGGKLIRGSGSAGEVGHMLTSKGNEEYLCNCGKTGCFEASTSAAAWTNECKRLSKKYPESELAMKFSEEKLGSIIFDRSIELNSEESATRDKIIVNISNGLVSLFEIFDNEAFILGGSMAGKPYDLVLLINQDIKNRFQFPSRVFPQILVSTQKGEAGIVGAALIAQNE